MKTIVFFGSSSFSIPVLEALITNPLIKISSVVTTPDQPVGRHLKLTPNPVKVWALAHNLQVFTEIKAFLATSLEENTVGVVAAYGRILGPQTLSKFNGQIYGIHPSLLPKYRGPSPLQHQILDNANPIGVTLYKIDEGEDTGDILIQEEDVLKEEDTTPTLGERLFLKGVDLLLKFFAHPNNFPGLPQDSTYATDTQLLSRQDGFIVYSEFLKLADKKSSELRRKFNAFYPWPGVWTFNNEGERLILETIDPSVSWKTVKNGS